MERGNKFVDLFIVIGREQDMAFGVTAQSGAQGQFGAGKTDVRAMSIATMLFFMWGFLTCLNDILIPHLKAIFDLNYAQAMMVQFCFFSSYFIFAMPSGAAAGAYKLW